MLIAILAAFAATVSKDTPEAIDAACLPVIQTLARPGGGEEVRAAMDIAVSDITFSAGTRPGTYLLTERRSWIGRERLRPDTAFFEDGKTAAARAEMLSPRRPVHDCEKLMRLQFAVPGNVLTLAAEKGQRITVSDRRRGPYRLDVPKEYAAVLLSGGAGGYRSWQVARRAELRARRDGKGRISAPSLAITLQNTPHDFGMPVVYRVNGRKKGIYRFHIEKPRDCPASCGRVFEVALPLTWQEIGTAADGPGLILKLDRQDGVPFDWQWIGPNAARQFLDALGKK